METIKLNIDKVFGFVKKEQVFDYKHEIEACNKTLEDKSGKGNEFLGWLNLPSSIGEGTFVDIDRVAASFKGQVDILVVIGIGGSYLGAKCVIEALSNSFQSLQKKPAFPFIIFAGQNISEDYHYELMELLHDRTFGIIVISKSGTTTEPAVAFRLLKNLLETKIGKAKAKDLIVAVTDEKKGSLRKLATQEGYQTFVIPDDVGGRYSVLTPVGLLPIAAAGFNIRQLVAGAKSMEQKTNTSIPFEQNIAAIYAAVRNALYKSGKKIEILASYTPKLTYLSEWWKQLFGESEGKELTGIFPASVSFTADLHSMGQYIQEGQRIIFETVVSVLQTNHQLIIPNDPANLDTLNFLSGEHYDHVNKMAELGTMLAHVDGGVPNIRIEIPKINEYYLGELMYFFERSCGLSGYALGVNPFDQSGVEDYKRNMFALLNKPGFEEETRKIRARLD